MAESSTLLASIFQNVSDAILIVDHGGFVVGANPSAERMTGWASGQLNGMHLCEVCKGMATCSEDVTCLECFSKRFSVPSFEMLIKRKDGSEYPVMASSSRLSDGLEASLVIIMRDMSEQQRAERERMQRRMTSYVIRAQEEERKRISRDLHDGVGQALYSINVGLRVLGQLDIDEEIKKHIADVQRLTMRTLEEVKSLSVELRPSALDDLGLVPAIRSYGKRYEQTFGILTELDVTGRERRYQSEVETALYRICQEAMINAAKYADTDKITVELHDSPDSLTFVVRDYGQGFDLEAIEVQGTGLGLYGMRERAGLLGGTMEMQSAPGEGTSIQIRIPLDEKGGPLHVDSTLGGR